MRAFVTGAAGFVGRWLVQHLVERGDGVVASDAELDVTDGDAMAAALRAAQPDAVYHLAALTHVGESWEAPAETLRVNAMGTLSVTEAARRLPQPPRVLLVGSAEVYGAVRPDELPLTESSPLRPATPYAMSKVAAEFVGRQAFLGYGLPVVCARAFNHAGPGQSDRFVVSALARQVADAERTGASTITAGNLEARRDLLDVRDVVRAYRLLVERGVAGETYQVCSGSAVSVAQVARRLCDLAGVTVELQRDPQLARPLDVPVMLGDSTKLRAATGWAPARSLDETLADTLAWWRDRRA